MEDLWVRYDDLRVALILFHFGLAISKSSGDREPARYNSDWPLSHRPSRTSQHDVVVLVDLTSSSDDSFALWLL